MNKEFLCNERLLNFFDLQMSGIIINFVQINN